MTPRSLLDGQRLGETPAAEHLNWPGFRMNKSGTLMKKLILILALVAEDLRTRVERLTGLRASEALWTKN